MTQIGALCATNGMLVNGPEIQVVSRVKPMRLFAQDIWHSVVLPKEVPRRDLITAMNGAVRAGPSSSFHGFI